MDPKTRDTLELFVEQAERVSNSRFVQEVNRQGGIQFDWQVDPPQVLFKSTRPDDHALTELGAVLRWFIQDNESTSFRNMAKSVLADDGVSQEWKDQFTHVRSEINNSLDSPHRTLRISLDGVEPLPREIFETFFYGGLVHSTPRHRQKLKSWHESPLFQLLQFEFVNLMADLLEAVLYVSELCKAELAGKAIPPLILPPAPP